ncbi:MAG TPA: permease [Fimbriiglobus sp.]|jgi:hypothetical protein
MSSTVEQIQFFVRLFTSIVWEAMPFIVLGALIAGILEELLPQQLIGKIMPKSALPAVVIGGLLGLIFPMCECGIVVVMRRLLRKGLPLSCCIAYMLAGPILNVIVLMSTWVAFKGHGYGYEMVLLRAGMGFFVACTTGLVVHIVHRKHGNALLKPLAMPQAAASSEDDDDKPVKKPLAQRIGNISQTALHDFMDIMVFLILGSLIAAVVKLYITPEQVASITRDQPYLTIPVMMFLAVVMCLCSEADAFVAASFTEAAFSAKLSFLVLGPMFDLKLLMMFTRVFRTRLIAVIVGCTVTQVLVYCMIFHAATGGANPHWFPNSAAAATQLAVPVK